MITAICLAIILTNLSVAFRENPIVCPIAGLGAMFIALGMLLV